MRAIKGLRQAAFPVGFNVTSDSYYDGAGKHANVLTEAVGISAQASSSTSFATGTGSKAFTTSSGLAMATVGRWVRATSVSTGEYMQGRITSYSGSTLTINMTANSGTGTHTDWTLSGLWPDYTNKGFPKAGGTATYLIYSSNNYLWQQYKAGTYVIKGTGTGAAITVGGAAAAAPVATLNCSVVGSVITTGASGAFRATVVLSAMVAPTGDALIVNAKPSSFSITVTGGTGDLSDLVICHTDDEAHQAVGDAASFFTIDALADYTNSSHGPLRMMQWQQMTNAWVQDAADIVLDGTVGIAGAYIGENDGTNGAMSLYTMPSPEMMGRLATATGCPLWINVHPQLTDAGMASFFTRLASTYPSGTVIVEAFNEPWNSGTPRTWMYLGTQYALSGQPGFGAAGLGTAATTDNVNKCQAHLTLRAWKQAELVFTSARVKRVVNIQLGAIANSQSCLDYVDSTNIVGSGGTQKVGNLMYTATVATYLGLTPDTWLAGPGTSRGVNILHGYGLGLSKRWLVQNQSTANALFCEKAWRNSVDQVNYYVGLCNTALVASGYPTIVYEYEGHQPDDSSLGYCHPENVANGDGATEASNPDVCMAYNSTTGAMVMTNATVNAQVFNDAAEVMANWFTDGDIIQAAFAGAGGVADYQTYKCKVISGSLYAFTNGANYATGLGAQVTGGSNKNVLMINVTKFAAWASFLNNLWWSNPSAIDGQSIMDYMHEQYRTKGFRLGAGFKCLGSAYHPFYTADSGTNMQTSANKPHGHWYPDTAVATRLKALT